MANPLLNSFLPLFYISWFDDVLTETEMKTMKDAIDSQDWLTKTDKDELFSKIDVENPPSRSQINEWKEIISKGVDDNNDDELLTDVALKLALVENPETDNEELKKLYFFLQELEKSLGIISSEAIFAFKEKHDTITSKYVTEATFEVEKLTEILDGSQAETINKVKKIFTLPAFKYEESTDTEVYREKVLKWCKILAKEGLGATAYPKEHGGEDDVEAYFSIMETLSYHDLSLVIKFGVQFGLWGMSIQSLGTEKHYKKYLKDVGSLKLPGCFAMTETNHGSNVKSLETTATYDHKTKTFTVNTPHKLARKEYIGNAARDGQMATVFAKLIIDGKDHGVNAFIVPIRDSKNTILDGITIEDCGHKMGLNGVDNGIIYFKNVVIPKENMLDRFASVNSKGEFESPISSDNRRFFTMLGTLVGGRIGIPRSALAVAKSALAIAIRYGDQRRQFGPQGGSEVPILNYRMHQRRLMPYLAKSYAIHFALQYVTKRFLHRKEAEMQEIEALAAGMKAYSTWNTRDTVQECREACGGKGYLSENRFGALKNDTEVYTTFEGDNTVLMNLVAKNRLSEFRNQFGEMNAVSLFNYVVDQAKTSITYKNPFATRNTDENHLADPEFHLHAFQFREKEILASAAKRIKKLLDSGLDSFDAFNIAQHHLINVGQAYLERVVLEQFQLQIETTNDKGSQAILGKLFQLYALSTIEKNASWYLEQGYMEGVKTKAIRKAVNQLCWEIRQNAVPLVHAFNIPESCLSAPIVTKKK
ncbi:acyl-CoA dehydrogenase family protein [Flavobacterium macacae]|uniref:acyl-CoA oxidase n=1 Tax=Flavobacterium macacae TaxID=2488993 RepID=A0A3P3WKG1_9FLAO|nr:acyl-CoA dehydrogenase [Flavobacterium macacae]RRJ93453.1 acyl-CoA oxidase [Flavobacterium macacae]